MTSQRVRSRLLTGMLLALVALGALAGCLEFPTVTPNASTETPNALGVTETATQPVLLTPAAQTARVLPEVLSVRDSAGGIVIDWLQADQLVTVIECKDNWCQISTKVLTGYVFRGCLSGNTDLGCSAK